jgi:hypothetical protein
LSWFRKKPSPSRLAKDLGPQLVKVAVRDYITFQQAWKRQLDYVTQVTLLAEFTIILVAVTDRIVVDEFSDRNRSKVMDPVVDTVRDFFANQSQFGETRQERVIYFERLFADRLQKFATCSSFLRGEEDSLMSTVTRHLEETFLKNIPEA